MGRTSLPRLRCCHSAAALPPAVSLLSTAFWRCSVLAPALGGLVAIAVSYGEVVLAPGR
jgi:hypothetical protein